jgi:hypothetical protein
MHLRLPAPAAPDAGVVFNLAPFHTPAANPAEGGLIAGSIVYTAEQATALLAGLHYVNLHTELNPAGESRGQLIAVNIAPTVVCPPGGTFECTGGGASFVSLNAQVADADNEALAVIWSVGGVALQTNHVAAGSSAAGASVSFEAIFTLGVHAVAVTVLDGTAAPVVCTANVTVVDTTPPTINSVAVTPDVLWPPNRKMKTVTVTVDATDACGPTTCRIVEITSSPTTPAKGKKKKGPDWAIKGDLTASLRAERSGQDRDGRTYTLTIECRDESGNASTSQVTVLVPHDQGKKDQPPKNEKAVKQPAPEKAVKPPMPEKAKQPAAPSSNSSAKAKAATSKAKK